MPGLLFWSLDPVIAAVEILYLHAILPGTRLGNETMRIILSRKGFDSSAGGFPSPILPDGRLCSLPIPDELSPVRYGDIAYEGINLGDLIGQLGVGHSWDHKGAHLDPDLRLDALPRVDGWKPMLGQSGSAQGHLRNEGVAAGDLFLFFGSFRAVYKVKGVWRFDPGQTPRQIIWGWLRVGEILKVDELPREALPWARYHPHFAYGRDPGNTLYLAADLLSLDGATVSGAGTFPVLDDRLVLTAPGSRMQTQWQLPAFFAPSEESPGLSYHRRPDRWESAGDIYRLSSAYRGQEFVVDVRDKEAPMKWLRTLLAAASH
ncbi:hypothetical protein SA496_25960 [Pseudomonas sp. JS3066]|uniref:Nmad3 family putative nucleotide modification protein n=2 Tax=unclassified Pseudomonas TaxID=196821 RepID=UPI002E7C2FF0|nr:hypothetical protein [Pseudomonas sp. JS3066]WVK93114.1 hypothetical protein SA496_25960 [Pseudomonas sp. JS3066]